MATIDRTHPSWAKERVRAAGLRVTPARLATLRALVTAVFPLTHAEIAHEIRDVGADKATVLRNLADLVSAGLAKRYELGDRVWRYEAADPKSKQATHPHFLCIECGQLKCLENNEAQMTQLPVATSIGQVTEVLYKGRCSHCIQSALG